MHQTDFAQSLKHYQQKLSSAPDPVVDGKLTRMVGMTMEAIGCQVNIGERCIITSRNGHQATAEVVGFAHDKIYLMSTSEVEGFGPGAKVTPLGASANIKVGNGLLGRVLDGLGQPIDGLGPLEADESYPLQGQPINPLLRHPIDSPLDVGVAAIDSLLTVGRGQRMGLLAGSGVGKSVLLGMMTRFTEADVIVVGLIGERGREVKEFIENILGIEGRERSVVVAVPADNPPLMRLQGAQVATAIAESFRDKGQNVLLLMDSLTRFCQAQREIALAVGEPPATKGYPPSVFAKLPQLVERAGNAEKEGGSITAFYTVLAEGDDQQDPIVDAARAILDGHVVLSRSLADEGHYPAIDIEQSVSRAITQITHKEQQLMIRQFKRIYSTYQRNRDLISIGAYEQGSDQDIDEAIQLMPAIREFLQQDIDEKAERQNNLLKLTELLQSTTAALPGVINS
ncbi:flagellar protein export ATPase FliI [Pleionea sp. CnH1-48]|uniref:flagellar protein export ATPase FliI n=1 Tax=Pleionea sp. CnH1-48 TaxID=2954494 RepID=UPI0020982256|nr:flagellar protein export ATPase FliI [Pleionea sp. CnH1-48]MCO7226123.1 flagellar protein export ATPase FliI [Pleionea sp. CnH1-48]